jgi:hypothetical protein
MTLQQMGILLSGGWLAGWLTGTAIMTRMIQRGGK